MKLTEGNGREDYPVFDGYRGPSRCEDDTSNCKQVVGDRCCFNREIEFKSGVGVLAAVCCKECEKQVEAGKCRDSSCYDKLGNCSEVAKYEYQCQNP
jgi:hypothetical protein